MSTRLMKKQNNNPLYSKFGKSGYGRITWIAIVNKLQCSFLCNIPNLFEK